MAYSSGLGHPVGFRSTLGGPYWLNSDRYDVEAKAAAGAVPADLSTKARDDRIRLMLQVLLADRFKLALRRESSERSVYGLVVTKNASKLTPAGFP